MCMSKCSELLLRDWLIRYLRSCAVEKACFVLFIWGVSVYSYSLLITCYMLKYEISKLFDSTWKKKNFKLLNYYSQVILDAVAKTFIFTSRRLVMSLFFFLFFFKKINLILRDEGACCCFSWNFLPQIKSCFVCFFFFQIYFLKKSIILICINNSN